MPLIPLEVELEEDHRLLLDAVREYAQHELLPLDRKWDRDESSVIEVLPHLGEMGLLNLCVPEEYGGLAVPYRVYAAIIYELAKWSPSVAVTIAVHSMVGKILTKFVEGAAREEWLQGWGRPEHFGAFALSEAGAGSDAAAVRTTADRSEGGWVLNGEKMWITNGMHARWILTLARVQGVPEREALCAFVVDAQENGVKRDKILGKMGIRGSETAVISLSGVFVPMEHRVGKPGQGLAACLSSLNEGRIGIAAQAAGIAEACLDEMVTYAREREQFGRPIGKFQAVANMIADSAVELEASRSLIWRAAGDVDAGRLDPTAASMAKLYATEAANRIAYRAVQVHGGTGYVNECRVEQLYRDARVTTIYEGTSEVQRIVIARQIGQQ
ncbi:MAG: acyl-CoA dehydrogenase family protein [Phycisphaerae bacterium]|nr:acyl-CoA dehydrogenase family protein [Phycisphaerae bacterium]